MTEQEVRILIHNAVYRIIRIAAPPSIDGFFKTTIKKTLPPDLTSAPTNDFWMEAIAVEIQSSIMAQNEYILGFNRDWLTAHIDKPWEELITYINSGHLVPLH